MNRPNKVDMTRAAVLAALLAMSGATWSADDTRRNEQGGQDAQPSAQGAQSDVQDSEREFMKKAARGGMLEVESSKLAMERASSPQVKAFAKMLHEDHSAANGKLEAIARKKGVQLPTELDAKQKAELDRLRGLQGEAFEQAYMERLGVHDHEKDIQAFERQARTGKDDQLKRFANETLPTLRKHLTRAQQITGSASAESGQGAASQEREQ